jgi:hypothetical protein
MQRERSISPKRVKLKPVWLENAQQQSLKESAPVVDGKLDLVFMERKDGERVSIKNAPPPVVQYSAYGMPISEEQLKKLAQRMGK